MNILRLEFRLIPVSSLLMSQKKVGRKPQKVVRKQAKVGRKSSPFFLKTAS